MKVLEPYKEIFCGELHRKIYICNSLAAGRALVKAVSKHYTTVYGVEVETLQSFIIKEYAGALKILSPYKAQDVILELMTASDSPYWCNEYAQTRKVAKSVHKILLELELEEVGHIQTKSGTQPVRVEALEEIRRGFSKYKQEKEVYEYPDLLKKAIEHPINSHIYVDYSCQFSKLEQSYIQALTNVNNIGSEEVVDPATVRAQIRENSKLVACKGNEITFILEDIIASGHSFQDIGIMLWDGMDVYDLYTHASAMEIPLTLSQGIPLKSSSMYQILSNIQEFIHKDYSAEILYGMFNSNTFKLKKQKLLSKILTHYKVSFGIKRYQELFIDKLEDTIKEINITLESQEIQDIKDFFKALLAINKGTKEQQIEALISFTKRYTNHIKEEEQQAYATTKGLVLEARHLEDQHILSIVLALMEEKTYMSNIAGGIYCGPVTDDLHVKRLYMAGMTAGSLSASPLLFEEDREATANLKTNLELEQGREDTFYKMLHKHEGDLIFTYTSYHTGKRVPMTPNYAYGDLKKSNIVETEQILSLPEGGYPVAEPTLGTRDMSAVPSYQKQLESVRFSASSLEKALECPVRFYLQKILGVYEDKMYEVKEYKWLEANERGTFIHDVLDKYYDYEIKHQEKVPDLEAFIDQEEKELIKKFHCNDPEIQKLELEAIRTSITHTIKYFDKDTEFSIYKTEHTVGSDEPFLLKIGEGEEAKELLFTGSIDRVDQNTNGKLRVIDYKSGKINDYLDDNKIKVKLQSYLYKLVMDQIIAEAKEEKEVIQSTYFFTEYKTLIDKENVEEDKETLMKLLDLLGDKEQVTTKTLCYKKGKFILVEDKSSAECGKYCEYKTFCRKRGK